MKKKLKYLYRIFGVLLTFVVIFNFFIGGISPDVEYDSVEKLQADYPDYYYFDLDLESIKLSGCYALFSDNSGCFRKTKENECYGYSVYYKYKTDFGTEEYAKFFIGRNDVVKNSIRPDLIIDGIECEFSSSFYNLQSKVDFGLYLYFILDDNIVYSFENSGYCNADEEDALIEYFISIITSVITNRYKGPKQ